MEGLSVTPVGSDPLTMLHVIGVVPVAVRDMLNGVHAWLYQNMVDEVIVGGVATVSVATLDVAVVGDVVLGIK